MHNLKKISAIITYSSLLSLKFWQLSFVILLSIFVKFIPLVIIYVFIKLLQGLKINTELYQFGGYLSLTFQQLIFTLIALIFLGLIATIVEKMCYDITILKCILVLERKFDNSPNNLRGDILKLLEDRNKDRSLQRRFLKSQLTLTSVILKNFVLAFLFFALIFYIETYFGLILIFSLIFSVLIYLISSKCIDLEGLVKSLLATSFGYKNIGNLINTEADHMIQKDIRIYKRTANRTILYFSFIFSFLMGVIVFLSFYPYYLSKLHFLIIAVLCARFFAAAVSDAFKSFHSIEVAD